MKKCCIVFGLVAVIFAVMFLINGIIMYFLYDINLFDPPKTLEDYYYPKMVENSGSPSEDDVREEDVGREGDGAREEDAARDSRMKEPDGPNHYFISPEEIEYLKQISLKDKLTAMAILSALDQEGIDSIVNMSEDGITQDEYDHIVKSYQKHLTPSDLEILNDILSRNKLLYAEYAH